MVSILKNVTPKNMLATTLIANTKSKCSNLFIYLCKNFYLNLRAILVT